MAMVRGGFPGDVANRQPEDKRREPMRYLVPSNQRPHSRALGAQRSLFHGENPWSSSRCR